MRQEESLTPTQPPPKEPFAFFLSFCSNKPSKPIDGVISHIDTVNILNEIRSQTQLVVVFLFSFFPQPFRSRSMIRIKEAITFMKRSFQSTSAADSLQI